MEQGRTFACTAACVIIRVGPVLQQPCSGEKKYSGVEPLSCGVFFSWNISNKKFTVERF